MRRPATALVLGALMVALGGRPAFAQEPAAAEPAVASPPAAAPDDRIRQAAEAYDHGDFDRALALLQAAYAESPKPALLFNMAQVQRSKSDCATAALTYRRFLDTTSAEDANRQRAERYEAEMIECAARATAPVAPPPPKTSSAPPLTPRPPVFGSVPVQLTNAVPASPDQPEGLWTTRRIAAYTLIGAGIVAAGASGVMALKARSTSQEVVEFDKQVDREKRFDREQTWAFVLGGAALLSATAGVTVLAF